MILTVLLAGCNGSTEKDAPPPDTGYAYRDTADADTDETAETGGEETGESPPPDTSETAETAETADTAGETGTEEPAWLSLAVSPATIAVHAGATWTLRVVATDPEGTYGDLPDDRGTAAFSVDDATIATVDANGTVTALAEGTTTVRVAIGGLEATCAVEVRADGLATVTVLDASTGLPIENAKVALPDADEVYTDASGVALLPVPDGGPITVSAWVDDTYNAVTVTGVVGRQLGVSILPKDLDPRSATLSGTVDFGSVADGGWSDVVIGFAAGSIQQALAATRLEDLFSDERTVTVFGIDVEAPANLFVEDYEETFEGTALPGAVGVWGMAGPLAVGDVTSGLSGAGDALGLLAANVGSMSWGFVGGLTAVADADTSADLAPAESFSDLTSVSLPPLSSGFAGDEEYFVLVTEERVDEGFVVTGLGTGPQAATSDIPSVLAGTVADSLGTSVLAYAQVGGVGSGGPVATAVGTMDAAGNIAMPMLQDVAILDSWDPAARGFGYTVDADADFVRVRFLDNRNRIHDLIAPGSWSGTLPSCVSGFGLASSEMEILSISTSEGSFEAWVGAGDIDPGTKPAVTAARTYRE